MQAQQTEFAIGQRYIGAGAGSGEIAVHQVPGNALGAYLDGASIQVYCNAQDATGDTMNDGVYAVYSVIYHTTFFFSQSLTSLYHCV